jgi:hypothetical protein
MIMLLLLQKEHNGEHAFAVAEISQCHDDSTSTNAKRSQW